MATRIRTCFSALIARGTSRALAGAEFCDSCAQVCDAACRAAAHRDRVTAAFHTR